MNILHFRIRLCCTPRRSTRLSECLPLGEKQRHVVVRGGVEGKFDPSEAHSPPFRAATISVMAYNVASLPNRLMPWVGEQGLNLHLCLS